MAAVALLCLVAAAAAPPAAAFHVDPSCDGSTVALAVRAAGRGAVAPDMAYGLPSAFGPRLATTRAGASPALPLVAAAPSDACGPLASPAEGGAVVAARGGCSFLQKAQAALAAGAGLLIVYQANQANHTSECFAMGVPANASASELVALPPATSVDAAAGALLLAAAATGGTVAAWQPDLSGADWSAAILFALAVVGVAWGAELAARDEACARGLAGGRVAVADGGASTGDGPETLDSAAAAAAAVLAMAAALLVAYFAPRVVGALLTFLFLVASADGIARGARVLVHAAAPAAAKLALPCGGCTLAGAASVGVAAAAAGAWALWGPRTLWPLHDALALALVVGVPRALRVPSLATSAVLLLLAAANDVWWVFLQPRATGSESVMVAVASSAPALALLAPLARGGPRAGFALLGLGDVAIPGAAVAAAARWDAAHGRAQRPAALAALGGYAVGLVITYAALLAGVGGGAGQPALLYLAPCMLCAALADAAVRGELRARWAGLDAGGEGDGRGAGWDEGGGGEDEEALVVPG